MCLICSLGDEAGEPSYPGQCELLEKIRRDPGMPIALRCHSDDQFAYQSPGREADTPEGADFNQKRDMEMLRQMDLAPGTILPANIALRRLHRMIPLERGICVFGTVTSDAWKGCRFANRGRYERGHAKGLDSILPPRDRGEMAREKQASLKAMLEAGEIRVRPHILLCAANQYGDGIRPPFEDDNLPEMLQHIIKHPDTPITLVAGPDWMMCAPCGNLIPGRRACVVCDTGSGGLFNEMKDLNVLQAIGLTFGSTLPAKEMYRLIFERIPRVSSVCALSPTTPEYSVWADPCGRNASPCPMYERGREELMKELDLD
jgi:hypothetical protein